jgi:hypothetical protein
MELSTTREARSVRPLDSFPVFYGIRMFSTEFTRALHLFLSWARPIQSTSPHPTATRSILILSTHLRLGLPSGLFPSGFPTNNLYAFLFSPISDTYLAHLILITKNNSIAANSYNSSSVIKYALCTKCKKFTAYWRKDRDRIQFPKRCDFN